MMEINTFIKNLIAEHPHIVKYGNKFYNNIYYKSENYINWYLTGTYPPPSLRDPLGRWPGDDGSLYPVLDRNYCNNFLHQHGDLAFKEEQIRRHVAHHIAQETREIP